MDDFFNCTYIHFDTTCMLSYACHKINMKHVDLMFTLSCSHLSPKLTHIGTS